MLKCAVAFSILMVVTFFLFLHQPLSAKTSIAQQESEKLQDEVRMVEAKKFSQKDFDASMFAVKEEQRRFTKALPQNLAQAGFLQELQQKATAHGVVLQQITPNDAMEVDDLQALPIHLRLAGSYFAQLDFLRDLRESERLVQIARAETKMGEQGLTSELTVCIFATKKQ